MPGDPIKALKVVMQAAEAVAPKIKGFTTWGDKFVDLSPTKVVRTIGKTKVEEPTQHVARLLEGVDAQKGLNRATGNTTSALMRKAPAPPSVTAVEELANLAPAPVTGVPPGPKPISQNVTSASLNARTRRTSKLNESMVREIRKRSEAGEDNLALSKEYELSKEAVRDVVKGYSWAWVK